MPVSSLALRRVSALAVLAVLVLSGCLNEQERSALAMVNDERGRAGVAPLQTDADAQQKAEAWAAKMAREQRLSHSNVAAGINGGWRRLGENVAAAASVGDLHRVLMGSGSHRSRLLDGRFTHVGIGIARGADGKLYTAQVFVTR